MFKEEIDNLERIGNLALLEAKRVHDELGAAGEQVVQKNQYGETALVVDIEAEKAVLRVLAENEVPIKVISEEHGVTIIGKYSKYLGILDGLDGSGLYKEQRGKARYGTMFGIYDSLDPKYEDYIYGGIIDLTQSGLYFASRTNGANIMVGGQVRRIYCSQAQDLNPDTLKVIINTEFDRLLKADVFVNATKSFAEYSVSCARSTAIHYADITAGNVDLVLECTRKDNLEIAVAFPLITEAGGITIDHSGQSIAKQKYLTFGQDGYYLLISAATPALAKAALDKLNS